MRALVLKFFLLMIILSLVYYVTSTLSKEKKKKGKEKPSSKAKPSKTNVMEKGLVTEEVTAKDVIDNFAKFCEKEKRVRKFDTGNVLGYVTPWNSHGYDVAKMFGKFSMISPVWLQVKRKPRGKFHVTGTHDIDRGWMNDVRKANTNVQILPRLLFDSWSMSDYKSLFSSEDEIEELIEVLTKFLGEHGFDGVVIEIWSQMPQTMAKDVIHLLEHMSQTFQGKELTTVLVIPPPISFEGKSTSFTREHFQKLSPFVDAFSLMTYDFSVGSGKPGPNAPLSWMKACVENLDPEQEYRHKILLGLNFYGYLFSTQGGAPVIGDQYIKLLKSYNPQFNWQSASQEHIIQQFITPEQKALVMFPTLRSIHMRLELAKQLGTGISIWELGQGLDYFYDLL